MGPSASGSRIYESARVFRSEEGAPKAGQGYFGANRYVKSKNSFSGVETSLSVSSVGKGLVKVNKVTD